MKINILQEILRDGMKIVDRVSQKSLTLPILQNTLLKTSANLLCLEATNLEIGVKCWNLAKTEGEGQIAIPTRVFSNLVASLPNKPVSLEVKGLTLSLKCGQCQTELKGFSASEFPIIPQPKEGEKVEVKSSAFCQAISQVVDIPSPSVARPEVSGIYFSFQKDLIKIVATDSFRLGEKKFFLPSTLSQEYSLILPQQTAKELINIFGEKEADLQVYFSPNQILFETIMPETSHPQTQLVSRLIEGEYPNYQEIIPKKAETQIICLRNEFISQIKTASIFSGKINEVKLKINPKENQIFVFSQNPDLGEYKGSLTGKIKGKEIEVSFNHRFLIDGLLGIKSPEVIFELTNEESPAVLKPVGEEDYLYVAMPIKTS